LRGIQGVRRAIQATVGLLILGLVFARATASETQGAGATTTPESVCPFGGIETFWTWVTTGGYVPHVHPANIVLAVAVLLLAFLARGAFCGWVCPLGFLQDISAGVSAFAQRRVPALHRAVRALRRRAAPLAVLDRPLRLVKYAVLAWAVWGAAAFGVMVFRDVDPWIAVLNIGRESTGFGMLILATTLLGALVVDRPWCRYACPLGAVNGLVARFSPIRLERQSDACVDCGVCTRSCPMGLPVATASRITAADCNGCLECVESCPRVGGLELRAGLPVLRGA
jgi:polyferredoxin